MPPAKNPKPKRAGPPSEAVKVLSIDGARPVSPHLIKEQVGRMCLAEGDQVSIEVVGRAGGPRYERAVKFAREYIERFGGRCVAAG